MFLYARVTRESSPLEEGIVYVESEVFVVVCVASKQERAGMCVERIWWKPNKNNYTQVNIREGVTNNLIQIWKKIFAY